MTLVWMLAQAVSFQQIALPGGQATEVPVTAAPVERVAGSAGTDTRAPAALPTAAPPLPVRGSRFSPLYRARDVVDLAKRPARVTAKLLRLDAAGAPDGTACTATFIAPRKLLTAGHCLVDRTTGKPHAAFRLLARYDDGRSGAEVAVTRAWVESAGLKLADPTDARVTPTQCTDYAVIEIAEPLGAATGWAGMSATVRPDAVLHRFSYPQTSSAARLRAAADKPGLPEQARAYVLKEADRLARAEPDFAPTNLYYEYGVPDDLQPAYVADRNGYVAPGRSGSALIDADGDIVALLSRSYGRTTYSCRLSAAQIGAIRSIVTR